MENRRLPPSILQAPVSVVFRCADPTAGNVAAYAMASAIQSEFVLFEVRAPPSVHPPSDLPWSELVPAERHLVIWAPDPMGESPPHDFSPWSVTRRDREDQSLTTLIDIMTAPEASQRTIGHLLPTARPLPILVANGAQVAQVFPDDPSVMSHLIALQKQLQYSTISTSDIRVRRDHLVFDYVFDGQVMAEDPGTIRLRCARAPWGEEWKRGDEFSLDSIGEFSQALDRLRTVRISLGPAAPTQGRAPSEWRVSDSKEGPFPPSRLARTADDFGRSRLFHQ